MLSDFCFLCSAYEDVDREFGKLVCSKCCQPKDTLEARIYDKAREKSSGWQIIKFILSKKRPISTRDLTLKFGFTRSYIPKAIRKDPDHIKLACYKLKKIYYYLDKDNEQLVNQIVKEGGELIQLLK